MPDVARMSGALRIGIQLPEVERVVHWSEYAALARAAETDGFDSIWVGDHLLYRGDARGERGPWDTWTLLAALAAITTHVRIGPLVACTAFSSAGLLAKHAATVQDISDGRLVLGLGAGWNEVEFRAYGIPFDHRVDRFAESFEAIRRLLSGERVTMHGSFVELDDAVLLPLPRRRPELMIGSNSPRMLSIALPYVDAWNTWFNGFGNTPDGFARLDRSIDDAVRAAGRRPEDIRRSACVYVVLPADRRERVVGAEVTPLQGPPRAIADGLRAMAEAGADEVIIVVDPITERSIHVLGEAIALLPGRN